MDERTGQFDDDSVRMDDPTVRFDDDSLRMVDRTARFNEQYAWFIKDISCLCNKDCFW